MKDKDKKTDPKEDQVASKVPKSMVAKGRQLLTSETGPDGRSVLAKKDDDDVVAAIAAHKKEENDPNRQRIPEGVSFADGGKEADKSSRVKQSDPKQVSTTSGNTSYFVKVGNDSGHDVYLGLKKDSDDPKYSWGASDAKVDAKNSISMIDYMAKHGVQATATALESALEVPFHIKTGKKEIAMPGGEKEMYSVVLIEPRSPFPLDPTKISTAVETMAATPAGKSGAVVSDRMVKVPDSDRMKLSAISDATSTINSMIHVQDGHHVRPNMELRPSYDENEVLLSLKEGRYTMGEDGVLRVFDKSGKKVISATDQSAAMLRAASRPNRERGNRVTPADPDKVKLGDKTVDVSKMRQKEADAKTTGNQKGQGDDETKTPKAGAVNDDLHLETPTSTAKDIEGTDQLESDRIKDKLRNRRQKKRGGNAN